VSAPFGRTCTRAPVTSTLCSMNEALLFILIWLPVLMVVTAAALYWRRIRARGLFVVVGTLSLFGLQGIAAPVAVGVFLPGGGGLSNAAVHEGFYSSVQLSALLVLCAGAVVLWWLGRSLSRGVE
jgi:hypothetical protein